MRSERENHRVVVGGGLQLEVEALAELLAQRETQRPIEPPAPRRVDHELHSTRVVEEALEHESIAGVGRPPSAARETRRDSARSESLRPSRCPVSAIQKRRASSSSPRSRIGSRSSRKDETSSESSSVRAGASPAQKGIFGVAPSASTTRTLPASTRRIRQVELPRREDVPGQAVDREILADAADEGLVGIGDHAIIRDFGDRAARGQRGQPRASPSAKLSPDPIAMDDRPRADRARSRFPRKRARRPRRMFRASTPR